MLAFMRWLAAVVVAVALLFCRTALADVPSPPAGKPTPADEATAKKNFESALKLYGEGAYAEAQILFETSYKLSGRPSALKNVAQCQRSLKKFVESYETLEELLARHEAQVPAADKRAVQQAMEEIAVLTATIAVVVSQPDADVEIDGRPLGKSPLPKPKRVGVGAHHVKVTKAAFEPFEQDVSVASQEAKKIDVTLAPEKTTGTLAVRDQGARDVHVFVDGEDKGPAPWEGEVSPGEHTIEVKSARFASEPRKTRVTAKQRVEIVLDAIPLTGHLRVTTVPATATIYVDGKPSGTGVWEGDLPEGEHRVEAKVDDQSQVRTIVVARGQSIVQEIPVAVGGTVADYVGIYVKWTLHGNFAPVGLPDNEIPDPQPNTVRAQNRGGFLLALGSTIRVGRSFGIFGGEIVGRFFFEHRDQQMEVNAPPPSSSTRSYRLEANDINYFFGLGPRVTSKDDTVRFTFGIAPGVAIRNFAPRVVTENDSGGGPSGGQFVQGGGSSGSEEREYARAGYTALGFASDFGVLFGRTPGTKFFLGIDMWIDIPPGDIVVGPDIRSGFPDAGYRAPGRGVYFVNTFQFYVGPALGIQFGH